MVRSIPAGTADFQAAAITPLAIGLFISVTALVALCAKHYRNKPAKELVYTGVEAKSMETKIPPRSPMRVGHRAVPYEPWDDTDLKFAPRSPLASPRAFLTTLSHKTIPMFHAKKATGDEQPRTGAEAEDEGDDGLWKRKILLGERCQPPDFSGAIHYDDKGRRLTEFPPRSPRGSSPLANFSFPVVKQHESAS